MPSIPLAPAKCQGSTTIVHILPLQEGGKYSQILFTFGTRQGITLLCLMLLSQYTMVLGSSMCFARESKPAFVLYLPAG